MEIIRASDVTKVYETTGKSVAALNGVNLKVEEGEFLSVVGPSGSGKTTLLNVLGLLDEPTTGSIMLNGEDVSNISSRKRTQSRKDMIGFVFQDYYLLPTLTAEENVVLPRFYEQSSAVEQRAKKILERVGLADRASHKPDQLSGGQKQRVAIARALVNDPAVLLADEPTGNLDRNTSGRILKEFERVCDTGVAIVAVTHDPFVEEFADRTVEIVDGVLQ